MPRRSHLAIDNEVELMIGLRDDLTRGHANFSKVSSKQTTIRVRRLIIAKEACFRTMEPRTK